MNKRKEKEKVRQNMESERKREDDVGGMEGMTRHNSGLSTAVNNE